MCIENLQGVTSLQYSRLYERLGEYERERKPSMNTNLMHQGIAFYFTWHLCRGVYNFRLSVCPFVCPFVIPLQCQSFWLKFLQWCISR